LAVVLGTVLPFAVSLPSPAIATTTANILVTATPDYTSGVLPPIDFTALETDSVYLSWTKPPGAVNTMVRVKYGEYPADRTDGYLVYYGADEEVTDYSVNFEVLASEVFYRAWSEDAVGDWSVDPAEDWLFGGAMTLLALGLLALGLTVAMFVTRQMMLGFPSALFWAIVGGWAYTESVTPWGDWQYFLFFASMGMAIFSMFAAYALRTKKEELEEGDEFIDEGKDDTVFIDEQGSESGGGDARADHRADRRADRGSSNGYDGNGSGNVSPRIKAIRDRAKRRREAARRGEHN